MPELTITSVHTASQHSSQATLFHPFDDALTLVMHLVASQDLMDVQDPHFEAAFQIINPRTNQVDIHQTWFHSFAWGRFFWISLGNNWGPSSSDYTTPYRWGLNWTPANTSIFGFRGLIKAYSWQGESGLQSLDAFDVSDIHWFRIEEVYML